MKRPPVLDSSQWLREFLELPSYNGGVLETLAYGRPMSGKELLEWFVTDLEDSGDRGGAQRMQDALSNRDLRAVLQRPMERNGRPPEPQETWPLTLAASIIYPRCMSREVYPGKYLPQFERQTDAEIQSLCDIIVRDIDRLERNLDKVQSRSLNTDADPLGVFGRTFPAPFGEARSADELMGELRHEAAAGPPDAPYRVLLQAMRQTVDRAARRRTYAGVGVRDPATRPHNYPTYRVVQDLQREAKRRWGKSFSRKAAATVASVVLGVSVTEQDVRRALQQKSN